MAFALDRLHLFSIEYFKLIKSLGVNIAYYACGKEACKSKDCLELFTLLKDIAQEQL